MGLIESECICLKRGSEYFFAVTVLLNDMGQDFGILSHFYPTSVPKLPQLQMAEEPKIFVFSRIALIAFHFYFPFPC